MYTLIIVLLIIVAILTCGIVLIQESKGGGLASGFSSSNQVLGVRKTTDFLEKTTWTLAAIMVVLCVASAAFAGRKKVEEAPIIAPTNTTAPAQNPITTEEPATPAAQEKAAPTEQKAEPAAETKAAPAAETEPAAEPAPAEKTPSKK